MPGSFLYQRKQVTCAVASGKQAGPFAGTQSPLQQAAKITTLYKQGNRLPGGEMEETIPLQHIQQ